MADSKQAPDLRHHTVTVKGAAIHAVEAGSPRAEHTLLCLHGWPADWSCYERLMSLAASDAHVVAIDLPGVGGSTTLIPSGEKSVVAEYAIGAADALGLRNVTVVGHDGGGMVAYECLRRYEQLRSVVILSVVIPGLDPWEDVRRNPYLWHWGFHAVPELPEQLVFGNQAEYFKVFYDAIAARPEAIGPAQRRRYVEAYSSRTALTAGFDWFRAFAKDSERNARDRSPVRTPLLYMRGDKEPARIPMDRYLRGLRDAGVSNLSSAIIADSGHFTPEEQPEAVWREIRRFLKR